MSEKMPSAITRGVHELVKLGGAIVILVGLATVFVIPAVGLLLLACGGVAAVLSVIWTRRERHIEQIHAIESIRDAQTPIDTTTPRQRLIELQALFDDGVISAVEYEAKRAEVIDRM